MIWFDSARGSHLAFCSSVPWPYHIALQIINIAWLSVRRQMQSSLSAESLNYSPPPPSISASFSLQGWSTFKIFGEIVLSISLQNIWLPSWIFNAEGDRGENEISREGVDSVCRGGERQRKEGTLLLQIKHGKSVNN